jgi:hypothetical protein
MESVVNNKGSSTIEAAGSGFIVMHVIVIMIPICYFKFANLWVSHSVYLYTICIQSESKDCRQGFTQNLKKLFSTFTVTRFDERVLKKIEIQITVLVFNFRIHKKITVKKIS